MGSFVIRARAGIQGAICVLENADSFKNLICSRVG